MGALLGRRAFMGYVLVVAFVSAALFAYISGSSFVFESLHGVSATTYSLIFATNAVGMLLGGAVFSRLSGKRHLNTLLAAGVGLCLLGALAQVLLVATVGETLAGTWITLFVTAGGIGLVFPGGMSLGQAVGRVAPVPRRRCWAVCSSSSGRWPHHWSVCSARTAPCRWRWSC
ncbi:hypothetical protein [Streptomyces sp. NPDC014995]|uniref:hypothetical protein n=1 Tax=Streptomyces sp. NPDC014995 TaxID=3364936 RepID=UPI0036FF851F